MVRGLFVVVALLAACATARAADLREQAKEHYQVGRAAYEAGRWQAALIEFQRAYAIVPIPDLIYNIGHCQERLNRYAEAAASYRLFLAAKPDAQERKELETRIVELDRLASSPPPALPPPSIDLTVRAPPPPIAPAGPPVGKKPLYRRWWLWTAVGAAALAVGLGVGLGVGLSQTSGPPALGFPAVTVR